jgi:hypothetical protein
VLLDRKQRKWLIGTLAGLAAATAIYIPYALGAPQGPRGGSALGLAFGIAGSALMVFAGLLSARKQVPVWRVGRAQTWLRGHVWLGLLSLPLILFHAGFHFGGALTTVLMSLFLFVVVSGIFGAILQNSLPRMMTERVPMETIYEEIGHVRAQLVVEAENIMSAASGPFGAAPAAGDVVVDGQASTRLSDFYQRELRPFLENPKALRSHPLAESQRAEAMFEQLRTLLPPPLHAAVDDLENICEEERQLARQEILHRWLHGWLLVHVPLSFALLLLGAVHAVMALRY